MKHVFIINPTAGKSDSRQKIYDMAEKLRQDHGLEVQCLLTKKQGHATEIARRLCQSALKNALYLPLQILLLGFLLQAVLPVMQRQRWLPEQLPGGRLRW